MNRFNTNLAFTLYANMVFSTTLVWEIRLDCRLKWPIKSPRSWNNQTVLGCMHILQSTKAPNEQQSDPWHGSLEPLQKAVVGCRRPTWLTLRNPERNLSHIAWCDLCSLTSTKYHVYEWPGRITHCSKLSTPREREVMMGLQDHVAHSRISTISVKGSNHFLSLHTKEKFPFLACEVSLSRRIVAQQAIHCAYHTKARRNSKLWTSEGRLTFQHHQDRTPLPSRTAQWQNQ